MPTTLACSQGTPGCSHAHQGDPDPMCESPVALVESNGREGWAGVLAQRFADGERSVGLETSGRLDLSPAAALALALALFEASGERAASCSRCGRPDLYCICTHRVATPPPAPVASAAPVPWCYRCSQNKPCPCGAK